MKLRSGAREGGLAEDCPSCRGLDWLDRIRAWHAYLVSRRLSIRVQERAKRAGSQEVFARPHRPPVLTLRPYLPLPTHDARQRQATLPRQRFLLRKILSPVRLPPRPITSTASSRSSTFRTQAPIRRLGPPLENAAFKRHHTRSKRRMTPPSSRSVTSSLRPSLTTRSSSLPSTKRSSGSCRCWRTNERRRR